MSHLRVMRAVTLVIALTSSFITINAVWAQSGPSVLPRCAPVGSDFSEVRIANLANGERYAVFGTGQGMQEGDGRARLFFENLREPADAVAIDTGVGHNLGGQCGDAGSDCNALTEVAFADINSDGFTDWAYAGDLHGNVWAFDLTGDDGIQNINVSRLFTSCGESLMLGSRCALAHRQPITSRVALARNTHLANEVEQPNINVYWGTGRLRTVEDSTNTSSQTFYSVLHTGQENGTTAAAYLHEDLMERAYISLTGNQGEARSVDHGSAVDYHGHNGERQYGWYLPLPEQGERVLNSPLIVGGMVIFTSLVPTPSAPCEEAVASWVNVLSLADGLVPWQWVAGDRSEVPVLDYNQNAILDDGDLVGDNAVVSVRVVGEPGLASIENDRLMLGSSDDSDQIGWRVQFDAPGRKGRVGWYQLR